MSKKIATTLFRRLEEKGKAKTRTKTETQTHHTNIDTYKEEEKKKSEKYENSVMFSLLGKL